MSAQTQMVKQADEQRLAKVLTSGNLHNLTEEERLWYYHEMCRYIGVDPVIKPFDLIETPGKPASGDYPERPPMISLYPNAKMAGFLLNRHQLNAKIVDEKFLPNSIYTVRYRVEDTRGGYVEATGVVDVKNLYGERLANAMMRAETKAFRRAVLRKAGLTMTDESEMETVPGMRRLDFEPATGEIGGAADLSQLTGPVLQDIVSAPEPTTPAESGNAEDAALPPIPATMPTTTLPAWVEWWNRTHDVPFDGPAQVMSVTKTKVVPRDRGGWARLLQAAETYLERITQLAAAEQGREP